MLQGHTPGHCGAQVSHVACMLQPPHAMPLCDGGVTGFDSLHIDRTITLAWGSQSEASHA